MATASDVLKVAVSQIGYKESPANSNKTKYGSWFGLNGQPWCAIFLDWCFEKAGAGSLFPHNANAAYAQDQIVSKCGGSLVMEKNTSKSTRKAYLSKAKAGDIVDFDFGRMDAYRRHIGIVERVDGDNLICIEGNTTPDGKSGSQSNGGMVCRKVRSYLSVCSAARPAYNRASPVKPTPDPTTQPLEVDGIMGFQTVCRMQKWLGVGVDGEIGKITVTALQKKVGAKADGEWGKLTSKAFQKYLNKNGADLKVDGIFGKASVRALQRYLNRHFSPAPTPAKTNGQKIADKAKELAWAAGTPKSKYSYPNGSATAAFKAAIAKVFPDRSKWGKQTRAGASCDVFVATVIRATGYDTSFPRGLDGVEKHMKNNPKWVNTGAKKLSDMKAGDVVFQLYKGGGGHIFICVGNSMIANAHYNGKTFGIIQKFSTARAASKCKVYNCYRAKG